MTVPLRPLRIAAHTELASLVVMLANLATAHIPSVSSLTGPTHGCAYLFVVVATWRLDRATPGVRAVAFVPGVGGLLAFRRLSRPAPSPAGDFTVRPPEVPEAGAGP
ncbi:hypothetical protein ACFRH6_03675 [Streptomyces sp. NPDC056749]|uniref:hypothetical protein n=1 Tax=Streptomyces sp. NPDC056749 TaxID=3345936 RepID=UPI0036B36735